MIAVRSRPVAFTSGWCAEWRNSRADFHTTQKQQYPARQGQPDHRQQLHRHQREEDADHRGAGDPGPDRPAPLRLGQAIDRQGR